MHIRLCILVRAVACSPCCGVKLDIVDYLLARRGCTILHLLSFLYGAGHHGIQALCRIREAETTLSY